MATRSPTNKRPPGSPINRNTDHVPPDQKKAKGRPRLEWKHKDIESLGRLKATLNEIAAFCGVSEGTVLRWNTDPAFREARKRGEDSREVSLRRWQWRAAERGSIPMLIFLGKNELGQRDNPPQADGGVGRQGLRFRSIVGADGSIRTELVVGQETAGNIGSGRVGDAPGSLVDGDRPLALVSVCADEEDAKQGRSDE